MMAVLLQLTAFSIDDLTARPLSSGRDPTHNEVIKGRNRVSLCPQANLARAIAGVSMIQEEHTIEIGLDVIAYRDYAHCMPLAQRRRLYGCCGQLVPPLIVVIQPKVVL